jgi:hypothetical protein
VRDNRFIICLILFAILGMIAIAWLIPPVQAYYYVQQGDSVAIGERVDLSGAIGWQDSNGDWNLAYYGRSGSEMDPQYTIKIVKKSDLYNYYIDPAIFGQRLGPWYQFYGNATEDNHGNTLAFRVVQTKNITPFDNTTGENVTVKAPDARPTPIPTPEILPVQHVSDYLIARGDAFKIKAGAPTNAWIFGYRESVYDYRSVNNTIEFTKDVISKLSAGRYSLLLQTHKNETGFLVRYNKVDQALEWFDPASFKVTSYGVSGKPPQEVLKKLKEAYPKTTDTFREYVLEVEEPTISINQVDSAYSLNVTRQVDYVGLDNVAFLDVRGYTNHIPDTIIKVCIDPTFNVTGIDSWKDAFVTKPDGEIGDVRAWRITVPVEKYNMAPGRHFIGARAESSGVITTADFYIYDNPENSYVPNKTMRYISGKYGPQELIPTPTPIVITNTVTVTVVQTVTVPVTPSNEQVYAQQKIVEDENWKAAEWKYGTFAVILILIVGLSWYLRTVYKRAKLK